MASLFGHFDVRDCNTWKQMFESDPAGRKQGGTGHGTYRNVDNGAELFVAVELPRWMIVSERLPTSGLLVMPRPIRRTQRPSEARRRPFRHPAVPADVTVAWTP